MQILRLALLILSVSTVYARRVKKERAAAHDSLEAEAMGKRTCRVTENDRGLRYGIQGSYKVKSCMFCKFHQFLATTLSSEVISGAEKDEDGSHCKCYTSPKFWEAKGLDKKFWFQFTTQLHACSIASCKSVFLTWANMFNKKKSYPGDNERMPVHQFIEAQEGYDFHCDDSQPEGLILPSPNAKIHELRLLIETCTDPEEKARLQKLLDELLGDKEVEVFDYDLDGEWGPEHEADASADGEHHTFFLKPCKSQMDNVVEDYHEIIELCGPPELGVSMKGGRLRVSYVVDDPWGPERPCKPAEEECQVVQNAAKDEGLEGEILSFRLRPCKSPSGQEITELSEIFAEKGCGAPTTKPDSDGFATLLPVKMDVASVYEETANWEEGTFLKYPCEE